LGNPADIRSDIYSLGIVLYELATGRIPFTSDSAVSLVRHHIYDTAIPPRQINPDMSEDLETVIMKCIQKDPNHRYGNPGEMLADLDALRRATKPLYATQTMANIGATMLARPQGAKGKKTGLIIGGRLKKLNRIYRPLQLQLPLPPLTRPRDSRLSPRPARIPRCLLSPSRPLRPKTRSRN